MHHDIEVEVKVEVTPDDAAICRDLAGQLEQPRPERRNAEWPRGISNGLMHRPDRPQLEPSWNLAGLKLDHLHHTDSYRTRPNGPKQYPRHRPNALQGVSSY